MTLAQVQIAVAIVVALIATWAGLLISVALLLPTQAGRAEYTLDTSPRSSFFKGLGGASLFVLSLVMLNLPNPLVKLLGVLLMSLMLAALTVGSAGLAMLMGRRISEMSGARTSFGSLVRGSLAYSLATGFPYIGWMVFAPLSAVFAFGAGMTALWPRREHVTPPVPPVVPPLPHYENR